MTRVLLPAALLAMVPWDSGSGAGAPPTEFVAPRPNTWFGTVITPVGDFDGDGIADLLVGDTLGGVPGVSGGRISILSGADGSILRSFDGVPFSDGDGSMHGDGFGTAVAAVGDIDGRGSVDFLAGAGEGSNTLTYAWVIAGEDGAILFDSGRMPSASRYGAAVAALGDLNGDEVPDFAVGSPAMWEYAGSPPGLVHVYSGADGATLGVLEGAADGDGFGYSIVPLGDVDGDGVREFAVGSPGFGLNPVTFATRGRITIFSGATLEEIRSFDGSRKERVLGVSFAALAPLDATGHLLVYPSFLGPGRAALMVCDAATGTRRRVPVDGRGRVGFGQRIAGLGDIDGDGVADVAVASWSMGDSDTSDGAVLVEVFTGSTGGILFAWRGVAGDIQDMSLVSAASLDGYGSDGLLIGVPHAGKVAAFQIGPGEVPTLLWVALQRPPDAPDADACGSMALGPHYPFQPLGLSACGLDWPEDGVPSVFLETAPDSESFVRLGNLQVGNFLEGTWGFGFDTRQWHPPDELRFATLGDLAGCRVEVRAQGGTVLLRALVPDGVAKGFSRRVRLRPPAATSSPAAGGSVRVRSSARSGTARIAIATHDLSENTEYLAWIEDGPSAGTFSVIGTLHDGRLILDSARGDALPGCTSDGASLTGRILEIRDGASVALRGLLP